MFSELYLPKIEIFTKNELPAKGLSGLYKLGIDEPYDFNKEDSVWIGFYSLYKTLTEYKNDVTISSIKDFLPKTHPLFAFFGISLHWNASASW